LGIFLLQGHVTGRLLLKKLRRLNATLKGVMDELAIDPQVDDRSLQDLLLTLFLTR
jgi:hypothetical protein